MRRNLTIKTRQYLTLGFVALLLAVAAGVAAWQLNAIGRGAEAVQARARSAGTIAALGGQVGSLVEHERTFLLNTTRLKPADGDLTAWNSAREQVVASLDAAETAVGPRATAPVRSALTTYQNEFQALQNRIAVDGIAKIDPTGTDGEPLRAAFTQLENRSGALLDDANSRIASEAATVEGAASGTLTAIALTFVITLALAIGGLSMLIYGPVVAEAGALARVCESVAVGDLTSRVPDPSDTELGRVGHALNAMLDNVVALADSRQERDQMQAAVMKLLAEVSGVAEGDLTVQAEVTSDVTGAVADSFNLMIGQLRQIIGQVQAASRQISTAVAELRDVTENLASGSDDQAAQAVEASVAIEEMAASIHYVSENASSSAAVAEQARVNAEHGTRAVTRTIEGMKAVRDQVQETAKRIKRLGESSQEIGEIVELIGDIGDRTSILALNASIQAAMAGEAGRGFAIVADEVERLADRATEATKRAGMLVKATQGETAEVMTAMEDTTREVINRSNIANEAGVALGEIQGVSNRLAELLQAISDAAQQQARGSEQVAKSMNEMSAVTRNTASGTKQTAAAINSLGLLVDNLNAIVTRFKLPAAGSEAQSFTQPRLVASR
jgi:methyl-accepting chemotaxis protein